MKARVETLSVIKGKPSKVISIVFPRFTSSVSFTQLSKGEVCLVFLKGNSSPYLFIDNHDGKLELAPEVVQYDQAATPQERMLSELLNSLRVGEEIIRMRAIEQLGDLGDPRAARPLRDYSESTNLVLRGLTLTARVGIGDAPKIEDLLSYLDTSPQVFDGDRSLKKYSTTGFSVESLQQRLLAAIERSIEDRFRLNRPSIRNLKDFDYVKFFKRALQSKVVMGNANMRRSIAYSLRKLEDKESVPDLIGLLDDRDFDVRYYGATALAGIYKQNQLFPGVDIFRGNESRYLTYWKDWRRSHSREFERSNGNE